MVRILAALLLLSACDSPSMAFMGTDPVRVTVEGSSFSVHRKDDRVEVYRTSREVLPGKRKILMRALEAIRQATGCEVANGTLEGDQAIIRARLDC